MEEGESLGAGSMEAPDVELLAVLRMSGSVNMEQPVPAGKAVEHAEGDSAARHGDASCVCRREAAAEVA